MRELQLNFILNKTTVRWLKILNQFERERTCSIVSLAEKFDVTQRTISSDLKGLGALIQDVATLIPVSNGYHFTETNPIEYLEKKRELVTKEGLYQILDAVFHGVALSVEEWAQKFYVSESTMRRYLNSASKTLRHYKLTLSLNPVQILGREVDVRKFFKDFYYASDVTPHTLLLPRQLIDLVVAALPDASSELINTDSSPNDFFYDLFIMIERYRVGYKIEIPKSLAKQATSIPEFISFCKIKHSIEEIYQIAIPEEEFIWLYLVTVTKRTLTNPFKERKFIEHFSLWPELVRISQLFVEKWTTEFEDRQIIETLIQTFFVSKKINESLSPVLNRVLIEIKKETVKMMPQSYQKNLSFLKEIQSIVKIDLEYIEDICSSLTLHTQAIEDLYFHKVKRIALILEGDPYICQNIKARLLRLVDKEHVVFFPQIYDINKDFLLENKIDLVITNYSDYLTNFILSTDYLLLKAVPDSHDWLRIIKKINPYLGVVLSINDHF